MGDIEIVDYRPAWIASFEQASSELANAVPGLFVRIEHIGSTSVVGLAAKPIIDMIAAVVRLSDADGRGHEIQSLSYEPQDFGAPGRLFFTRNTGGKASHHLHVVEVETFDSRNEILFRDWLRAHPEDALSYADLKRRLADQDLDSKSYTRAKTQFVQRAVDWARIEKNLPIVSVWEE